jgi:hypothetical protein
VLVLVFLLPIGTVVDLRGTVINLKTKGGVGRLMKMSSLRTFLTRPYGADVHEGTISVSVVGLWFKGRASVARCQ